MKYIWLSILSQVLVLSGAVAADGWAERVSCENSQMVVDGYHTYEKGFINHQLVIRKKEAIEYYAKLIGEALPTNGKGELVLDLKTPNFGGRFVQQVLDHKNQNQISGTVYSLNGHWIDNDQYEVYLTGLNYYPGMSEHEASYLGKWIFNDCKSL